MMKNKFAKKIAMISLFSVIITALSSFGAFAEEVALPFYTIFDNDTASLTVGMDKWQNGGNFEYGKVLESDGLYSMKLDFRSNSSTFNYGSYMYMAFPGGGGVDVSSILESGELWFKARLESDNPETDASFISIWLKNLGKGQIAWWNSKSVSFPEAESIKADGNWYDVKIPLKSFINTAENDFSCLQSLAFKLSSTCETTRALYLRDVEIKNIVNNPVLTSASGAMNKSGLFEANLEFDYNIKASSVSKNMFKIGEVEAKSVAVTDNKIKLVFDTCPDFPSNVQIDITPGIMSEYDLAFEDASVTVATKAVQDKISVINVVKKPAITGDTVSASAAVRVIWAKEEAQPVSVYLVLYDGDKIVETGYADATKQLMRKNSEQITVSFSIPEGTTIENPRAEIYFFDNMTNRTPIAEMQSFGI